MTEALAAPTPELDLVAAARQYDLIYAPLADQYASDAQIILFQHPTPGGFPQVRRAAVGDRGAFLAAIEALGSRERIDLPLAPRNPKAIADRAAAENENPLFKRGRASECYALPAIPLDIDVAGPRHNEKSLPTREQALAMIEALPLRPTLVVESSGGFHVYLALADLLEEGQQKDALARVVTWLKAQGANSNFTVDVGPTCVSGGLRVAGTASGKGGPDHYEVSRIIVDDEVARWAYGDFALAFPPPSVEALTRQSSAGRVARASVSDRSGVWLEPVDDLGDEVKVGTRLAAAWPVSQMLSDVFGAELRGARVAWPRTSGEVNPRDTHGSFVSDDPVPEVEKVIISGTRWQSEWGLDCAVAMSSWDVLGKVVCEGDWKRAARIAAHVMADEGAFEARVADLTALLVDDDLAVDDARLMALLGRGSETASLAPVTPLYPMSATGVVVDEEGAGVEPHAESVAKMISAGSGWVDLAINLPSDESKAATGLAAVVGGDDHGLWLLSQHMKWEGSREEGEMVPQFHDDGSPVMKPRVRIVPWLIWRPVARRENGKADESTFDVELIEPNLRKHRITDQSPKDSMSVDTALERLDAGVEMPRKADYQHIKTMISKLGYTDRQTEIVVRHTGPILDPITGKHRFLGVLSSVTADGIDNDLTATMVRGLDGDGDSGRPVQEQIGWDRLPDDEREAVGAVKALIGIAPKRPVVGIAMLGLLGAAPLLAGERTTVNLQAESGSGKSQAASCITPFFSLAERSTQDPMVNLEGDSAATVRNLMTWNSGLPIHLDDARLNTESAKAREQSAAVITMAVQGCFNGSIGGRADTEGGVRKTPPVRCNGLMTSERNSTQTAITNRCATIALRPGDIEVVDEGQRLNGIDNFTLNCAETGLANQMYASYLRWLMQQLDVRGEVAPPSPALNAIRSMQRWANQKRLGHMRGYGTERATGNAAYLRVGWDALFLWADAVGVRDLLPTAEEVDAALLTLVEDSKTATRATEPGLRIVNAIAAFIEGGRGHLVNAQGGEPVDALALGWKTTSHDSDGKPRNIAQGTKVGTISADGHHVVIGQQGIKDAIRAMDSALDAYSATELDQFLRKHSSEDLMAKDVAAGKVSTRLGIASRPRGYVLAWDTLFGTESPDTVGAADLAGGPAVDTEPDQNSCTPVEDAPTVTGACTHGPKATCEGCDF